MVNWLEVREMWLFAVCKKVLYCIHKIGLEYHVILNRDQMSILLLNVFGIQMKSLVVKNDFLNNSFFCNAHEKLLKMHVH